MIGYGYLLPCEEYGPAELVQQARLALPRLREG